MIKGGEMAIKSKWRVKGYTGKERKGEREVERQRDRDRDSEKEWENCKYFICVYALLYYLVYP